MKTATRFLAVCLVAAVMSPAAGAPAPASCTAGPARTAGAQRAHGVDPVGDSFKPWDTVYGSSADVTSSWVTGPSAWADRNSPQPFVAHVRVDSFELSPHGASIYFVYTGPKGVQFVSGTTSPVSVPRFEYGVWEATETNGAYRVLGSTTGTVDIASGTWSITLPVSELPTRTGAEHAIENHAAVVLVPVVRTADIGDLRQQQISLHVDETDTNCTLVLYEAM